MRSALSHRGTPAPAGSRRRRLAASGAVLGAGVLVAMTWTAGGLDAQVGDRAAIDSAPPPAHWTIPPAPVRTPEESMRLMDLQPGFRIELVASEPLVQDPIAFAFDERARLWVLEWPSYNWPLRDVLGLPSEPLPPSRLAVLTDADGDGRLDTRTVFASMDFPRGIQLVDGGVVVYALPEVVFLRDTDGDDKADTRSVIQTGLPVPVNPHLAPSSPSWTLDNWTYGLQVDERLRVVSGVPVKARAGRLAGQWGMSHDDYGRLFFSYNQDHIRGSLVPTVYAARNPHYAATAGIDVRIGADNEVWPHAITPGVNRRAQLRDDGRLRVFTANAAPTVYRGDQFPDEYRGNVFVGESAGRLIRRSVLTERDGIITGKNAYAEREFLFSHDERFRPVFSATGPDGALYVADMYRGIIEGHIFMTTFLRNQVVARGLQHPFHGMGRIYRIVHDGRPRSAPPSVTPGDVAGWVPVLAHPNGHWRDMAQRMLVSSRSTSVIPAVRQLAMSHDDARVRLHALWTLEGLGSADDELVRARLADRSAHVRIAALRVAEVRLSEASMLRAALALADDADVAVRRQLLYTLGESRHADAEETRLRLLRRDIDVPFMVDAFMSGAAGRELQTLETLAGSPIWDVDRPEHRALVTALATAIGNAGRQDGLAALKRLSAQGSGQPTWQRDAVSAGLEASARAAQPASTATSAPRDAATAALVERGRAGYAICAACHQADGRGLPAIAPPLAGSPRVAGPPQALIDIVLNGRDEDPAFPSMPPLASLPDDQLAAILTYVRQAWGNAASAIPPEAVGARRPAQGASTAPPLPRVAPEEFPEASRVAVAAALRAARERPDDPDTVGALAMLLQSWQQFDVAAAAYARAQALAPGRVDWWYLGGLTDSVRALPAAAARQFARALPLAGERAPLVSLRLADAHLAAGADDEATVIYQRLVAVPDVAAAAWYGLGRLALRRGDDPAAREALQQAVSLAPDFGAAQYALSQVHRRAGNPDAASVALARQQKCPACGPSPDDPWQARIAAMRDDAFALLTRGVAAASGREAAATAEAIRLHEAALQRPETRGQAHINLIDLYGRSGDAAQAKSHYLAALDQRGFEAEAHRQYAAVLLEQQQVAQALELFERASTLEPADPLAWQGRGLALERIGRVVEAGDAYGTALRLAPDAHEARFGLARLAMRAGQVDEAIAYLETLQAPHRAETPRYLFALSTAYMRRGRQDDALRVATEALSLARALGDERMATFIDGEIRKLRPTP